MYILYAQLKRALQGERITIAPSCLTIRASMNGIPNKCPRKHQNFINILFGEAGGLIFSGFLNRADGRYLFSFTWFESTRAIL